MRLIFISLLVGTLCGCINSLHVEKLSEFNPQSNTFILLDGGDSHKWDSLLRIAMQKKGFKILRFSSQRTIVESPTSKRSEISNEAAARYAMELYWDYVPGSGTCISGDANLINATLQITDIKTNEVLLVIKKGGVTTPCGFFQGSSVFEDLADALGAEWKGQ